MKAILILVMAAGLAVGFIGDNTATARPLAVSYRESGATHSPQVERPAPVAQPAAVIGDDEREPVPDSSVYPWRAISYLELTTGSGGGSCTGTFVGPDVLLTAAHCLWSFEDGFTEDIRVVPAKNEAFEPYGSEFAFDWIVPQEWIDSEATDTEWDFGLVVMNDGTLGGNVGWLSIANMTTDTLSRPDFMPAIVGYPGDIGNGDTMWANFKDSFATVDDFILEYEIDTAPGQSGSAILSLNASEDFLGYIVGIHTTGGATANHGTRIEEITLNFIVDLCTEFDCQVESYTEGEGPGGVLWVDADCDGSLTTRDNQSILRVVLQQNPLSQTQPCAAIGTGVGVGGFGELGWADADCDGLITSRDNQALMRAVLQQNALSQTEPCPDVGASIVLS